jgi:hypothetical protein
LDQPLPISPPCLIIVQLPVHTVFRENKNKYLSPNITNSNQKIKSCWVLVAHAYNPSYLGGKDKEDHDSKLAWANSLENLSQKYLTQKGLAERLKW